MNYKAYALAGLLLAAIPASALAEGVYYVRNDTGRGFACALRREHGSIVDRFELPAGREWSQTTSGDGPRVLLCDVSQIVPHYRLQAGMRYAFVEEGGRVSLREIGPR